MNDADRDPADDSLRLFDAGDAVAPRPIRKVIKVQDVFFEERREQSRVKTDIVVKYLAAWTRIMVDRAPNYKAAYIDLFAGPGRYEDGEASTPIRVLELIASDDKLTKRVVTYFNEGRKKIFETLRSNVEGFNGLPGLAYQPILENDMIGDEAPDIFETQALVPSLLFADPFGYKGLTLRLIHSVLKDWGSECIFFFNYNRIYMGLTNRIVTPHINAIFGEERANRLRDYVNTSPRPDAIAREIAVLAALREALTEIAGTFSLAFRFRRSQNKTSHYLVYVTKNKLGHKIMKEVMASASTSRPQGVASFDFMLPDEGGAEVLPLATPLDELQEDLRRRYAGKSMNVVAIFDDHNIGTPFTPANYKDALKSLKAAGLISCSRPTGTPIKANTMPDDVIVVFP